MRRVATLALLAVGTAALLAGALAALDRAFPPDLARAAPVSTIVVDREGRLLRGFTTADGKWRLAARAADVDPAYLAMLVAYEDRRFFAHPGVDALARREGGFFADGGNVAIVVVETAPRAERAWAGGADFAAEAGQVDLARARRSTMTGGSSMCRGCR